MKKLLRYVAILAMLGACYGSYRLTSWEYHLPPTHQVKNEIATVNNNAADLIVESIHGTQAQVSIDNSNWQWVHDGYAYNLSKDFHVSDPGKVTITKISKNSVGIHLIITYVNNRKVYETLLALMTLLVWIGSFLGISKLALNIFDFEKKSLKKRKEKRLQRQQNPHQMTGNFKEAWDALQSIPPESAQEQQQKLITLWNFYNEMDDYQKRSQARELDRTLNHVFSFVRNTKDEKEIRFSSFAQSMRSED